MMALRLPILVLDFLREVAAALPGALRAALAQRCRSTRISVNLDELSGDRLRDLGLLDGRGPSLRRPEREGRGECDWR